MAIIKCPECGHVVSDKAPFCPNCGVKIAGNPDILETQDTKEPFLTHHTKLITTQHRKRIRVHFMLFRLLSHWL